MAVTDTVNLGRDSFNRKAWAEAYAFLSDADEQMPLEPEDRERLAIAAYLLGNDARSEDISAQAHQQFLEQGRLDRAARCAFWLGMGLLNKGVRARGAGWIARAQRLTDRAGHDCVEQGFLLLPAGLRHLGDGAAEKALPSFCKAARIGQRFDNPDLVTLGRLGWGQSLIRLGKLKDGMALLDEAMAAVEADSVSPVAAGIVYCAVIEMCQEIYDLRRAQEWTESMTHWCESQPDLIPYRGQCLVRRAEIMELRGAWPDALEEAKRACERLSQPPGEPAAGEAYYRQAELFRLRGEFIKAEDAYREASKWGRKPHPGLALLRLAQGQIEAAANAIRHAVDDARDRTSRSRMLSASVEIMLSAGDLETARAAANELLDIATEFDAPLLHAVAAGADGGVVLAEGEAEAALDRLRTAWVIWEDLRAPYESARVRVLIARACRQLGDKDTAKMEIDAARWVFEQLGATPDLIEVDSLSLPHNPDAGNHGLTPRQLQVLRRVAAGKTNRAISDELCISERTVERHVSDIFARLNVSSRAGATAFAYQHNLM